MAPCNRLTGLRLKRRTMPKESIATVFRTLSEDDQDLFRLLVRGIIEEADDAVILSPYLELPASSQKRPRLSLVRSLSTLCDEDLRRFDAALQGSDWNFESWSHGACNKRCRKLNPIAASGAVQSADQVLRVLSVEHGAELCSLDVGPSTTMDDLRVRIAETIHIPCFLQRFSVRGVTLQSDADLFEHVLKMDNPCLWLERLNPSHVAAIPCLARGEGSLRELGEDSCGNREMVLAAVQGNGLELRFASQALRKDRDIVLTAVRKNGYALEFAADELKRDREVVMESVRERGLSLKFAAQELRADHSIVLAAVQRDAEALRFVASHLKTDRKIARATVAGGGLELFFEENFREETTSIGETVPCGHVGAIGVCSGICEGSDIIAISDAYE